MLKAKPASVLAFSPMISRLLKHVAVGVVFFVVLLDYQPIFAFPPIKKSIVHAQTEQTQTVSPQASQIIFQLPHPGYISTHFSGYHPGIDIATGLGMPIKPVADGTVVDARYNFWGLGLAVIINHGNGYKSLYAHMGKVYVKKDQKVTTGDYLGEVGLTGHTSGPHTHLEILKDNQNIDPTALLPSIREIPEQADFIPVKSRAQENQKLDFSKQLQNSL